jgi:hypothetical protein
MRSAVVSTEKGLVEAVSQPAALYTAGGWAMLRRHHLLQFWAQHGRERVAMGLSIVVSPRVHNAHAVFQNWRYRHGL